MLAQSWHRSFFYHLPKKSIMMNQANLKIALKAGFQPIGEVVLDFIGYVFRLYRQFSYSYSALLYLFITMAFCYYPVSQHWLAGFIMMSLPIAILIGLIASCYLFYKNQKIVATTGLVWVLFTFPVVKRLVGIDDGDLNYTASQSLKVLSFNGESFGENTKNISDWSVFNADIACFQEYSRNPNIHEMYAHKTVKLSYMADSSQIGLGILSHYPIVNEYSKLWGKENGPTVNGFICADIAYGCDTVRVVNVHLWSMGVRINRAFDAFKKADLKTFVVELYDSFSRLKEGFDMRNEQIREVESYVAGSQYPVIICGDFNETPFGYSYGKLSLSFDNAFEKAGKGLGFTLNRQPYCVRIDQQFFSSDWVVKSCEIISDITFSDHFPVLAQYSLKKSRFIAESIAQR